MEARIVIANRVRGMFAAQTEDGEFVILELLDTDEPEIGDIVSHPDFTDMGGETHKNITQGCSIVVDGVKPRLYAAAIKWRNGSVASLRNILLRRLDTKTGCRHQTQVRTG